MSEEVKHHQLPATDLLALEGMTEALAKTLAMHGIVTREDLAEQAAIDLLEIAPLSQEQAAGLVRKAREVWFSHQ